MVDALGCFYPDRPHNRSEVPLPRLAVHLLAEIPMGCYFQCCDMPIPDPALHGTEAMGITREEAVLLMGTLLPRLERWKQEES